jgi:molybdopterin-guanine dinucleotide biosynthesis protein A
LEKNMTKNDLITAAILAGGKSSRFGQPKEQATIQNRTLLEHAIDTAQEISSSVFIVSSNLSKSKYRKIFIYPDIFPDCGPIGGLYTALKFSSRPIVATIPCDMPKLPVQVYQILLQKMERNRPVVATSHQGLEPLVAIWPVSVLPVIEQNIINKNFSLRNTLRQLKSKEIYIPDCLQNYEEIFFLNINHKQDLKKLNHIY